MGQRLDRARGRTRALLGVLACSALLVGSGSASADTSSGGWSQARGGPGLADYSDSVGGLNASTVGGLHLLSSFPGSLGAVVAGVNYTAHLDPTAQARTLTAQSLSDGHVLWSQTACPGSGYLRSPVVGPTAIWVNDGQVLTVVSRTTHQVLACVNGVKPGTYGLLGPTQDADAVFTAHGNQVAAYDEATGTKRWQVTLPAGQASYAPAVDSGRVFVGAKGGTGGWVYALSATDGHLSWTFHRGARVLHLAVSGGRVFLGATPAALDEATGHLLWSKPSYGMGFGSQSPSTDGTRVYYLGDEGSCCGGLLYAFDAVTGKKIWSVGGAVPTYEGEGDVIVGGGVLYISDVVGDGSNTLVDAANGHIITTIPALLDWDQLASEAIPVDGSVYLVVVDTNTNVGELQRWGL